MQITANQDSVLPNTRYEINGAAGTTIDVHLTPPSNYLQPVFFKDGDFVSFRGTGAGTWRLMPFADPTYTARGRYLPKFIATTGLPGNAAPGERWTQRAAGQWRAVAMEGEGSAMLAADAGGRLHVSSDAGNTWTMTNSPVANWAAVAVDRMSWLNPSGAAGAVYMAAAARGGKLYRNVNATWTEAVDENGQAYGDRDWTAVLMNASDLAIGASRAGPIVWERMGTFVAVGTSVPLVRNWTGLAQGAQMVAVCEEGELWVRAPLAGYTLTQLPVVVDGVSILQPWRGVAASGNTIVLAGARDGLLYLSKDQGATWSRSSAPSAVYTGVAATADGTVIVATSADGMQMSRDGGATFTKVAAAPAASLQAIALSLDGKQMLAGGTQLSTSLGDRTAYTDGGGAITGGPGDFVELEAGPPGGYRVRSASGGPFVVR